MNNYYNYNNYANNVPAQQKYYEQKQINKQVQDNLRILDCMIRTMSTAENLCNIRYKEKKYNIDKKDILSFKTHEQIKDDFLMNIQCLNSMIHLFKKIYNSTKPKVLAPYDKNNLKLDLNNYRKIVVSKEPELDKYFKDFANLIDGNNSQSYSKEEMLTSFKKSEQLDEKKINNIAQTIMNQSEKEERKMKKVFENYDMTGTADLNNNEDDNEEMDYEYDDIC